MGVTESLSSEIAARRFSSKFLDFYAAKLVTQCKTKTNLQLLELFLSNSSIGAYWLPVLHGLSTVNRPSLNVIQIFLYLRPLFDSMLQFGLFIFQLVQKISILLVNSHEFFLYKRWITLCTIDGVNSLLSTVLGVIEVFLCILQLFDQFLVSNNG